MEPHLNNQKKEANHGDISTDFEEKESLVKKRQKGINNNFNILKANSFYSNFYDFFKNNVNYIKKLLFLVFLIIFLIIITFYFNYKQKKLDKNNNEFNKDKINLDIINKTDFLNQEKDINKSFNNLTQNKILKTEILNNKNNINDIKNEISNLSKNIPEDNSINLKYNFSKKETNLTFYEEISFNLTSLNYIFSIEHNIVEVEYEITFYDKKRNIIKPSELTLFYNYHFICHMKILISELMVETLANINQNKHFKCIEFFNINDKIKLGIKIYKIDEGGFKEDTIYFFNNSIIDYNNLKFKNENRFNQEIAMEEYINLKNEIKNNKSNVNSNVLFKKLYIVEPVNITMRNFPFENNSWHFINVYNQYFCFCKGYECLYNQQYNRCKYYFYLYVIDLNRDLYNKTDYLLADFFYENKSVDDAFPIFKEMIKLNLSAHYMTEDKKIIEEFCHNDKRCLKIIPCNYYTKYINGKFLEKYLDIILKLKVVISASEYYYLHNIFYRLDYITFIMMGHGITFFKHYLYNSYLSYKKYNKITAPDSPKIISIAKKYGWKDENIIRVGRPKWDIYDEYEKHEKNNNEKSLFLMFTWRVIRQGKSITGDYLNNILKLLKNRKLINSLVEHNITLFFVFHHMLNYIKVRRNKVKNYKFIQQSEISEHLIKSDMLITDFSSIIFEIMYRKKPIVMFIPDGNEKDIKNIYTQGYYDIINSLKNGTIYFENKFFTVDGAVEKIIYYINNNFTIEDHINKFYDSFGMNSKNNTLKFIDYLINLK